MAKQDYGHRPTLEESSRRFERFSGSSVERRPPRVQMHTFDGHVRWSYQMHHAFSELWTAVGHDVRNEVLIFTATGDRWIDDVDASSFKDVEQSDDDDQRFNVQIYDTLKVVENFVNDIKIPTITAINGRGIHWEMALMSDITLCTPDFILQDDHFVMKGGHVPGDGMTLALQKVLGIKRGNYMSYTNQGIDAEACLRLGAVNEIVERERIVERAWELARMIDEDQSLHAPPHPPRGGAAVARARGAEPPPARVRGDVLVQPGQVVPRLRLHQVQRRQDGADVMKGKD